MANIYSIPPAPENKTKVMHEFWAKGEPRAQQRPGWNAEMFPSERHRLRPLAERRFVGRTKGGPESRFPRPLRRGKGSPSGKASLAISPSRRLPQLKPPPGSLSPPTSPPASHRSSSSSCLTKSLDQKEEGEPARHGKCKTGLLRRQSSMEGRRGGEVFFALGVGGVIQGLPLLRTH